jgi:predicted helicase
MSISNADQLIGESRSWNDLFTRLCSPSLNNAVRGKTFERLTQLYLETNPVYCSKLRHVWRERDEVPASLRERLCLPALDEGIDLIAETYDGEYWSIQCKFRSDTKTPLTYKELSTFSHLSFVHCRGVELALVAHTAAKPVRKRMLLKKTTEVGLDRWLAINDDEWEQIRAVSTAS